MLMPSTSMYSVRPNMSFVIDDDQPRNILCTARAANSRHLAPFQLIKSTYIVRRNA